MAAKMLPGFVSSLTSILEADDRAMAFKDHSALLALLSNDGDYTTLLIQDTIGFEVVKATNFRGEIVLDRGLTHTTAKRFPVGSCVMFTVSEELIKDMICTTECCDVDEDYGTEATDAPNGVTVEQMPNVMVGGISAVLGEPTGFMMINGKKVPYYD